MSWNLTKADTIATDRDRAYEDRVRQSVLTAKLGEGALDWGPHQCSLKDEEYSP
ncbi:hypothetical protein [Marinobacterium rhizophilum]|uniref:hypothetical protein n=1 Tax=Marinobacterium rhizophilum TaxID=420402 RepID=UPI000370506C|nr:hypothetical protein [Marinobacterium rhizophilum]